MSKQTRLIIKDPETHELVVDEVYKSRNDAFNIGHSE